METKQMHTPETIFTNSLRMTRALCGNIPNIQDRVSAMLEKNAAGFVVMADRAAKRPNGKYNNYTEVELRRSAADYLTASKIKCAV